MHVTDFGFRSTDCDFNQCCWYSTCFIRQRLTMVILNGIIGYSVALFYLIMRAPDLALTQLVVETMTTILFIVSFSRLPNISRKKADKKKK